MSTWPLPFFENLDFLERITGKLLTLILDSLSEHKLGFKSSGRLFNRIDIKLSLLSHSICRLSKHPSIRRGRSRGARDKGAA